MKVVYTLAIMLLLCMALACIPVQAQTRTSGDSDSPTRWLSHQMNQPPPESAARPKLSQERIDEIRQLYELAKTETKKKSKPEPSSQGKTPPRPDGK